MANETKKPAQLFDHPGKRVVILIPTDGREQQFCEEKLQDYQNQVENFPRVVTKLVPGKLPADTVVYIAHKTFRREQDPETKLWATRPVLHISKPVFVANYILGSQDPDDFGGSTNVAALIDAMSLATDQKPATPQKLSTDGQGTKFVVKITSGADGKVPLDQREVRLCTT